MRLKTTCANNVVLRKRSRRWQAIRPLSPKTCQPSALLWASASNFVGRDRRVAPAASTLFGCVLAVQLVRRVGASIRREAWRLSGKQRSSSIVLVLILFFVAGAVGDFYTQVLDPCLSGLREQLGVHIWPHHWPLLAQMFTVFFLNELLWYWVHRAEHQWSVVWRFSGHGAHHAFQKLGALNFGLNHPLEYFFLLLPAALLELIFGIGAPALGASLLLVSQASIAHCNVAMNSRVIGWLFTTFIYMPSLAGFSGEQYELWLRGLVWDRVFGTFSDSRAVAVGSGSNSTAHGMADHADQGTRYPISRPQPDAELQPGCNETEENFRFEEPGVSNLK